MGFGLLGIVVGAVEESVAFFDSLIGSQPCYILIDGSQMRTLYTVSAADSAGTFQSPNPTKGISWPEASFTFFVVTMIKIVGRFSSVILETRETTVQILKIDSLSEVKVSTAVGGPSGFGGDTVGTLRQVEATIAD